MNARFTGWKAVLVVAVLAAVAAGAQEFSMHARVSYDAGGTLVRGKAEGEWHHAPINTLVLPGDSLWVDKGGTMELEFPGGAFLRMADGSKGEIQGMPPSASVRGWQGSFYVQRLRRSTGEFVFYSPAAVITMEADSAARIDVLEDGNTTISVHWGQANVRTAEGGDVLLTEGERCWVDVGFLPSEATPFNKAETDAFDEWNRERATLLATGGVSVPKSVSIAPKTIGVDTLDRYGEWVHVDSSYYWRPTVVTEYVPYRYGSWSYVPAVGHTWVGSYPFCYVTSHYGRWRYHVSYGWIWGYDPVWSPAWVASVRCGDYFIWAPVGYDYHPVYQYGTARFTIGGVHFGVYGTSYVLASNLYYGPTRVYGCTPTVVNYVGHHQTNIHIWNLNVGSRRPHVRVPYRNSSALRVRDYSPNRSIRGPSHFGPGGRSARSVARTLEASSRSRFSPVGRTGARGVRTTLASDARSARTRPVSIVRNARNPEPTSIRSRSGRSISVRDGDHARAVSGSRSSGSRSTASGRTVRGGDGGSGGSPRVDMDRSPRTPVTARGNDGQSRALRGADSGTRTRTARTSVRSGSTDSSSRSAREVIRGDSGRSMRSATPSASSRTSATARTPVRGTSPRVSSPRISSAPRTSTRTTSPRATSPSRTSTRSSGPRVVTRSPRPSSSRTPNASPQVSRTTPRSSRSSSPSITRTPSRSSSPSISRPSPSRSSGRTITRSAPSRSSSPSISRPSPSRSSSRSITHSAPSRSSSPSISRPSPSRSSSPSITRSAPSRSSSRSMSRPSPSRSSGRSRGSSARRGR